MSYFSIHKNFRSELRSQWQSVFGNGRIFYHIIVWIYLIWSRVKNNATMEMEERALIPGLQAYFNARFILKMFGLLGFIYSFLLWYIPYSRYKKEAIFIWVGLVVNIFFWLAAIIGLNYVLFHFFPAGLQLQTKYITERMGNIQGRLSISTQLGYNVGFFTSAILSPIWIFFSFYYYMDLYNQQRNLNQYEKVLADKTEAESVFLKTQINPHFLFNTLNNMYSLALQQSDDTQIIARKLKELLHYMLYDCTKEKVGLQGELDFINNYISLEKLRNKQETTTITIDINGDTKYQQIAPLLLINFIENAFKHGVKSDTEKTFVTVRLYLIEQTLTMDVTNSKPRKTQQKDLAIKESGGIGLANVKRRLAILYPNRHKLHIAETDITFTIHLEIKLT